MKVKNYYNENRRLEKLLNRINNSVKLTQQNKEYILNYYNHAETNTNIGDLRLIKNLTSIFLFGEEIKKPFNELTQQDYEKTFTKMKRERKWSDNNVKEYLVILKAFTRSYNKGELTDGLSNLKMKRKHKDINPNDLLTENEIKQLVNHTHSYRDKLMIMMLNECGLRISELLTLQLKDITIYVDKSYFSCQIVEGKTGSRTTNFIYSLPYLIQYLELEHVSRVKQNSFLFFNRNHHNADKPLSVAGARKLLDKAGERAGVTKRVNPHSFRHLSATRDARKGWTENHLRAKYGWSKTSSIPSNYIHLANSDILNKQLSEAGLVSEDKSNGVDMKPLTCKCGTVNPATRDYCLSCQKPISQTAIVQEQEKDSMKFHASREVMLKLMLSDEFKEMNSELIKQVLNEVLDKKS